MIKKCPYCEKEIAENILICPECNTPLIKTCSSCGEENHIDDLKCQYCGEDLPNYTDLKNFKNSKSVENKSDLSITNKNKIELLKEVRKNSGLTLKEAHDLIEKEMPNSRNVDIKENKLSSYPIILHCCIIGIILFNKEFAGNKIFAILLYLLISFIYNSLIGKEINRRILDSENINDKCSKFLLSLPSIIILIIVLLIFY